MKSVNEGGPLLFHFILFQPRGYMTRVTSRGSDECGICSFPPASA
jgi:hypothetical protein